jgi:hypothetical protein
MSRFTGRRKFVVPATALIALAFGVSVGLAKSGPSDWKVPLQYHNENCGNLTSKKFIGKANVERTKGVVTVKGKIHGGEPGSYALEIWDYSGCFKIARLDDFKVDASGDGDFAGATFFSSPQTVFITAYNKDTGWYNDSPFFWLGSS